MAAFAKNCPGCSVSELTTNPSEIGSTLPNKIVAYLRARNAELEAGRTRAAGSPTEETEPRSPGQRRLPASGPRSMNMGAWA